MRLALGVASILLMSAIASPATIYVPDNYATIQDAINASVAGDTVIVRPGTYVENIDFVGKGIHLTSESGPAHTTIDGGNPANPDFGSVVIFRSGEGPDSVLEGFTLTNGSGTLDGSSIRWGGGIFCSGTSPTIRDNIVRDNTVLPKGVGGGICSWVNNASPTIVKNQILSNSAGLNGGGVHCGAESSAAIVDNRIAGNSADKSGGGVYMSDFGCSLTGNTIEGNSASYGGGVYAAEDVEIRANRIVSNSASSFGGGVAASSHSNSYVTVAENVIDENVATEGGGIHIGNNVRAEILDNVIRMNTAQGNGGGISVSYRDAVIRRNRIVRNSASLSGGLGGGIALVGNDPSAVVTDNLIVLNQAYSGGGIASDSRWSPITLTANTLTKNVATRGGGIFARRGGHPVVGNAILWDNLAQSGSEIYLESNNNSGLKISYSCVKPGATAIFLGTGANFDVGAGVILTNPLFVDVASGDFHLTAPSPCRDSGSLAMPGIGATDFEGDTRSAGGGPDIGGDEFHEHLYSMGTPVPGSIVLMRVVGTPSQAPVLLALGSGVLEPPLVTPWGDFFLSPPLLLTANLGSLPPEGVVTHKITIPASSVPGTRYPFQAILGTAGNPALRLSNLLEIVIE